ncbi:MAG: iron ABC transporter ATP-binding protein [Cryobacterium sp.]
MMYSRVFPAPVRSRRLRSGLLLAGAAAAVLVLSACSAEAEPTSSASPSAGASETPVAEPTATPTPTPTASGTPLALSCTDVLSAEDLYAFNPNFGTAPAYSPEAGSAAETAVEFAGLACGWMNQSSNEIIEISVVAPNEVLMNQAKDAAIEQSNPVPTYGNAPAIEGFFTAAAGPGEAQVFTDTYWVVAHSAVFFEPGDAQGLLGTVVSRLP